MKSLYININNEQIQSNEELEVLNYDLDSDFFFYLGEKIAKGCNVENENALITDFNTQDNEEGYKSIIAQWTELKNILFSDGCDGKFEFTLPNGYIHWLRYNEKYNSIYERNFSHGEPAVITIDLEYLYEDSVEDLQRKILRKLERNDSYLEIDEIVFNDDAVTRKSSIIRTIKDKYDGIGFKSYNKSKKYNDLFPIAGITLCQTSSNDVQKEYLEEDEEFHFMSYRPKTGILFIQEPSDNFFSRVVVNEEQAFPKSWENTLGFKWGTTYDICKNILEKNCNKILWDKENTINPGGAWTRQIVFISVNNDYVFDLGFLHNKLEHITVYSNICPYCHSNKLMIFNNYDFNVNIKCEGCKRLLINGLECPECGSNDVENDGTDTLNFRCNKCGNYFG